MPNRRLTHPTAARTALTVGLAAGAALALPGLAAAGPPPPDYPEITDFCSAYLVTEQAAAMEDWDTTGTAVTALGEYAPEALADDVAVLAAALESGEFETPEFDAAYSALVDTAVAECGFNAVDVQLVDYAFGGIDQELPAGVTVFRVENLGTEVHELVLIGINDGVTATLDELIAMPEEESDALINFVGVAFAYPGTSGSLVADLTPGRYVAICFLPTGATPELMSQAPEGPPDPSVSLPAEVAALFEAPPHFTHGMVQEFTVVDG